MEKENRNPEDYRTYGRGRSVRLPTESYDWVGAVVMITACTRERSAYFAQADVARVAFETWREAIARAGHRLWALCIMPDHLHALIESENPSVSIGACVGGAKSLTLARLRGKGILYWQAKFHDHLMRPQEDPRERARYIVNNPVRAGLADDWAAWPWTYLDPEAPL
ncbi:MAG: transposase [Candidatus Hydrogenedentales bacterium]|jgi:REP element-mobilizing transposase RayT